jgi:hypothetical protein
VLVTDVLLLQRDEKEKVEILKAWTGNLMQNWKSGTGKIDSVGHLRVT